MKDENRLYMDLAQRISVQSHSNRSKVGCIIVCSGNIISFGYNGTPSGFSNVCEDEEGNTLEEVLHAESNAISKAALRGDSVKGAILYTTMSPCVECAKLIIQCKIDTVVYQDTYRDISGLALLERANIKLKRMGD